MEVLKCHDWPDNVRELQNVIERGVIMTTGPVLSQQTTEHVRRGEGITTIKTPAVAGSASTKTLADAERAHTYRRDT
jgi:DNA-binding NtrC family response regulator